MNTKWYARRSRPELLISVLLFITVEPVLGYGIDFRVYWNIPTFMCLKYNMSFENSTKSYGIIQNQHDDFRGDQISILYDPGDFPAILQNSSSGEYFYRNGGVPQRGNIAEHLEIFKQHVNELIPDQKFRGLAVIDFESWRPTYRQNFGTLKPYKDLSEKIEKQRHPFRPENRIQRDAERHFESAARRFMEETLRLGQKLRPNAAWGYYGLPYCFNGRSNSIESCPTHVQRENMHLRWLFESVDAVYPSVYLREQTPVQYRVPMVRGRIEESKRLIRRLPLAVRPDILVYHRYLYTDTLKFLTESETFQVFKAIKDTGADGIVLWGSSDDLNTKEKCTNFNEYLTNILGPVISSLQPTYSVQPIQ